MTDDTPTGWGIMFLLTWIRFIQLMYTNDDHMHE